MRNTSMAMHLEEGTHREEETSRRPTASGAADPAVSGPREPAQAAPVDLTRGESRQSPVEPEAAVAVRPAIPIDQVLGSIDEVLGEG